jgi:hypothetical protein
VTIPALVPATTSPLRAPIVAAAGVLAASAYVFTVDPNRPGHFPVCLLKATTGLDCPFCGSLRGVHDLLHGHLFAALDQNVLTITALPFAVLAWLFWIRRAASGGTMPKPASWVWPATVVVLVVFAVLRNAPGVPWLGSGIG